MKVYALIRKLYEVSIYPLFALKLPKFFNRQTYSGVLMPVLDHLIWLQQSFFKV